MGIGACRNGDQCNRLHNRPTMSQTLLLSHMYPNTPESLALANDEPWDDDMYDRAQQHLEAFYIEVFLELANYGEIEDLVVVDNLCDHMIGNVYVKYYHEEDAERALMKLLLQDRCVPKWRSVQSPPQSAHHESDAAPIAHVPQHAGVARLG